MYVHARPFCIQGEWLKFLHSSRFSRSLLIPKARSFTRSKGSFRACSGSPCVGPGCLRLHHITHRSQCNPTIRCSYLSWSRHTKLFVFLLIFYLKYLNVSINQTLSVSCRIVILSFPSVSRQLLLLHYLFSERLTLSTFSWAPDTSRAI